MKDCAAHLLACCQQAPVLCAADSRLSLPAGTGEYNSAES